MRESSVMVGVVPVVFGDNLPGFWSLPELPEALPMTRIQTLLRLHGLQVG